MGHADAQGLVDLGLSAEAILEGVAACACSRFFCCLAIGLGAAIAWSVVRAREMDGRAVVAFFPSDHHFGNEHAFLRNVEPGCAHAELRTDRVVPLGIEPDAPEESYGWIEPGSPVTNGSSISSVRRFREKPSRALAAKLMASRCLWNSFVMVGAADAFIGLMWRTIPELMPSFTDNVSAARHKAWFDLPAFNFSDRVLAARASDLGLIRAAGLEWSDLGEPQRVLSVFGAPAMTPIGAFAGGA
jgi:mannose-1-phosphate guanylyltransferase